MEGDEKQQKERRSLTSWSSSKELMLRTADGSGVSSEYHAHTRRMEVCPCLSTTCPPASLPESSCPCMMCPPHALSACLLRCQVQSFDDRIFTNFSLWNSIIKIQPKTSYLDNLIPLHIHIYFCGKFSFLLMLDWRLPVHLMNMPVWMTPHTHLENTKTLTFSFKHPRKWYNFDTINALLYS